MAEFLKFVDDLKDRMALHVEITYNKTEDWVIRIFRKGCIDQYNNSPPSIADSVILCRVQDIDMELCFAKAHVELKQFLLDYHGGY